MPRDWLNSWLMNRCRPPPRIRRARRLQWGLRRLEAVRVAVVAVESDDGGGGRDESELGSLRATLESLMEGGVGGMASDWASESGSFEKGAVQEMG